MAVQRTAETKPAAAPYLFPYLPVNGQSPVAKAAPFMKACVERVQEIEKPNILDKTETNTYNNTYPERTGHTFLIF